MGDPMTMFLMAMTLNKMNQQQVAFDRMMTQRPQRPEDASQNKQRLEQQRIKKTRQRMAAGRGSTFKTGAMGDTSQASVLQPMGMADKKQRMGA